jgi:G3E family GTPase
MAERKTIINIISGFLGTGKTTSINSLLAQRPSTERWAVVVNEFGEIGIDGALITDAGVLEGERALALREIPGGCVCCTSGPQLLNTLVGLVREEHPDRILIEPSGVAEVRSIIDVLRLPRITRSFRLGTVVTLIDPAQWTSSRHRESEAYTDQVESADVLVGNRTDLCTRELTEIFLREARELFPPKALVEVTDHGRIASGLLDLASDRDVTAPDHGTAASSLHDALPHAHHDHAHHDHASRFRTIGLSFATNTVFDGRGLADWIERTRAIPGVMRIKGVFHTDHGWVAWNATPGQQSQNGTSHRRDSRIEMVLERPISNEAPTERPGMTDADWLRSEVGSLIVLSDPSFPAAR